MLKQIVEEIINGEFKTYELNKILNTIKPIAVNGDSDEFALLYKEMIVNYIVKTIWLKYKYSEPNVITIESFRKYISQELENNFNNATSMLFLPFVNVLS